MYKKQMTFQKIVCLISLLAGALMFVYALGMMTDLYDALYSTMRNPYDLTQTSVPGSSLYYEMQGYETTADGFVQTNNGFCRNFLHLSIAIILLGALLYVTNTHIRRKYYIGNYISVILYSVVSVITVIWAHLLLQGYRAKYLAIDFAALKEHAETRATYYTDSTFWFDIHYLVFAILLIAVALQIYNLILKTNLMKEEAKLLAGAGRESA